MLAWDDIPLFLALLRERTTVRAAASLGCSQPTVVRRLAALEQALGLALFERTATGLVPTEAALRLASLAETAERAVCEFSTEVSALSGARLEVIRLTFIDHFERLLVPLLRQFRARWPQVRTELLASDQIYDLSRGEADIAIRGRERPAGEELVVYQLPPTGWTVYASSHLTPDERPERPKEVRRFPIALLGGSAGNLPIYRWLEDQVGEDSNPIRCSNFSALKSAVASGAALSVLPCTVGDADPDLVRCFPPMPEFDIDIYLIARRSVLRRPAARDLFDSIVDHFREHPALLMGERP